MRLFLCSFVLLLLACYSSLAQETFKVNSASSEYEVVVQVKSCGETDAHMAAYACSGPAQVSLYRKRASQPFQVLILPSVTIYKDSIAYNPQTSEKSRGLYEEEYSIVFDDFNFDGRQDLAICNGRNGGYGSPSYNVYLFDIRSARFIENKRLSRLTEAGYLGLIFPEAKNRLLVAYSKSGCGYHETEKYRLAKDHPVLVEKIIEDATMGNGTYARVTTRKLIDGKWVTRVRRQKINSE